MNKDYNNENYISDKLVRMQLSILRKNAKMTQKELSEKAGLSVACIANIERGENSAPTLRSITKYLDTLGYEIKFVKKKEL